MEQRRPERMMRGGHGRRNEVRQNYSGSHYREQPEDMDPLAEIDREAGLLICFKCQ